MKISGASFHQRLFFALIFSRPLDAFALSCRAMKILSTALMVLTASLARAETTLPDTSTGYFQLLFSLALIVAMIFGGLWLLKNLTQPRGGHSSALRVISGVAVGPRERVVIVEVGSSWLVVGVAPGSVNLLAETARLPIEPAPVTPQRSGFARLMGKFIERKYAARKNPF